MIIVQLSKENFWTTIILLNPCVSPKAWEEYQQPRAEIGPVSLQNIIECPSYINKLHVGLGITRNSKAFCVYSSALYEDKV